VLEIKFGDEGRIVLSGRFDAAQADMAKEKFSSITSSCVIDLKDLDYISSAGLGLLLETYKRLDDNGYSMVLKNMNDYIFKVFEVSGLDRVFKIE
jgi:anti-sigma B factor antagonist